MSIIPIVNDCIFLLLGIVIGATAGIRIQKRLKALKASGQSLVDSIYSNMQPCDKVGLDVVGGYVKQSDIIDQLEDMDNALKNA